MFCPKCGTQLPNDASFCPECGNSIAHINLQGNEPHSPPDSNNPARSSILREPKQKNTCPSCGCNNCEAHYKQNTTSTGGGYGCLKGGLGYLLAGPFGLLCGFCGKSQKTTTTNTLVWVCPNCGREFRGHDDIYQSMLTTTRVSFGLLAAMGILADLLIILSLSLLSSGIMLWIFGVVSFFLLYSEVKNLPKKDAGVELNRFLSEFEKDELTQVKKRWGIGVAVAIILFVVAIFV